MNNKQEINMSPRDEMDLDQIDALLGEDFSEDDELLGLDEEDSIDDLLGVDDEDDFDDLLGADDEEDSLDELLGAIDGDYLSEKEQVFLQNKAFLDSNNPVQLDKFFMDFQETLYGAMCEYGGEDEEDEFGADGEELEDLEVEIDSLSGSCFGSDEEAADYLDDFGTDEDDEDFGMDDDEFGFDLAQLVQAAQTVLGPLANTPQGKAAKSLISNLSRRDKRRLKRALRRKQRRSGMSFRDRRNFRRMLRQHPLFRTNFLFQNRGSRFGEDDAGFTSDEEFGLYVQPGSELANVAEKVASIYTQSPQSRREARRAARAARRAERRSSRMSRRAQRELWVASKRRYIRQLRDLSRCTSRFNTLAAKVSPAIAIKVLAGKNKFMARPFTTLVMAAEGNFKGLQAILSTGAFSAKDRRLARVANRCDRKLQMLRRIWVKLQAKGKTSGLQPPRVAFRSILNQLTQTAKSASKSAGGLIKAAAVTSLAAPAVAQRRTAAELAKIRAANLQAQIARRKQLTLAKLEAARQAIAERKSEARSERQELAMVASNPYMDQADMLALDRARQDRMAQSAAKRNAIIEAKERAARLAAAAEARRQALLEARRRKQMMLRKPKIARPAPAPAPAPVAVKAPVAAVANPMQAQVVLKRRIEITEKQLAAAVAAHRRSLEEQNKFPRGSTPWNAQYQKTKAYAQKSSELRNKLAELKASLK